jgi:hypothetical protein
VQIGQIIAANLIGVRPLTAAVHACDDSTAYGGGELRGAPMLHIDQLAREGLRLT